jgi:chromosome segregation ATPase
MNLNQLNQMVTWLDEERRRDKTDLGKLQQRTESQSAEIAEQARRMQELEGRLARTQARLTKFTQLEKALDQLRAELVLLIERHDEQRRRAAVDAQRVRRVEQESQARALGEIKKELQKLPRYEEELQQRRAEDQRLGEGLLSLQQRVADFGRDLENRTRNLPYLEEYPRQNAKRIAALQQETPELFKRTEAQSTKLQLLEELIRKSAHRIGELDLQATELKQEQKEFFESIRLGEQQRERQMGEWTEQMEEQRQKLEKYDVQMRQSAELYGKNKQALAALEKFEERLKQGQAEVAELQRLAEKRQRRQLDEWQAEDEKRWKKNLLIWEQHWRDQDRWNEEHTARLGPLDESAKANRAQITALWQTWQEYARRQIGEMQERQADTSPRFGRWTRVHRELG